ncbi:flagellin [Egibacter rhizosphaerae]|uniref:Flagellin n=1 Tax=Egibacter rhizosphaerae TaxID=1670831 RepID=A0A411YJ49_9ACTN|nr:flagellin [Egibacter rhizosphaerae]QBI21227.1 flagellin [Egibacter rhizosphaerae]
MQINQNIMAFNAQRNLSQTQNDMAGTLEKLSSGFRINRAADDAAGLSISEQLRSEVGGLQQAQRNSQDGISVVQTAEGALSEVHDMLQRMRDLSVQAENTATTDTESRDAIQAEIDQLAEEIDRISETTAFSGQNLLDGTFGLQDEVTGTSDAIDADTNIAGEDGEVTLSLGGEVEEAGVTFDVPEDGDGNLDTDALETLAGNIEDQLNGVGDNDVTFSAAASVNSDGDVVVDVTAEGLESGQTFEVEFGGSVGDFGTVRGEQGEEALLQVGANEGENLTLSIGQMDASTLGVDDLDVAENAGAAIAALDDAIGDVSAQRSELGARQNRLDHTIANLSVTTENLQASESRIRDADMASEMVDFTRHQVLQQSGTAMLAQANQVPQSVLSLLQ